MPTLHDINAQLDRLSAYEAGPYPVVSLYLNLRPDEHGRERVDPFLRKEFDERIRTYPASGPERDSLDADAERIRSHVASRDPAVDALAIFAGSGAGLFEAIELPPVVDEHRLFIASEPHLYPLARAADEYPRYAVLLSDTHSARIFVFAVNALERQEQIEGTRTRRHKMGGWSQARYQRHVENYHLQHAKEVVDTLARIVRDEQIGFVVLAGDEAIAPLLREQLPKDVAERVIDQVKLDVRASERDVLDATIAAMREKDTETDRERVDALLNAYRSGGLGCVGVAAVRRAFELGQVDELILAASPAAIRPDNAAAAASRAEDRDPAERAADELIAQAHRTAAAVRFIEDASLVEAIGGVGAFLRFRV